MTWQRNEKKNIKQSNVVSGDTFALFSRYAYIYIRIKESLTWCDGSHDTHTFFAVCAVLVLVRRFIGCVVFAAAKIPTMPITNRMLTL